MVCLFSSSAQAQELPDETQTRFVKSDCKGKLVRPVTEDIVRAATLTQVTTPVRLTIQDAHTIEVIHTPRYFWIKETPPSDVKAGYVPKPVPEYKNRYFPGTYAWEDDGVFELQAASYDIVKSPSGQESKRRISAVTAIKKKWVQMSPGRVEKVIVGYIQPPPAIEGGRLINNSPGVHVERTIPLVTKTEMIVTSQMREPAIIQQSYGACMAMPKIDDALE